MRYIDTIVIHHSVTPRDLELSKSLNSFNNNHIRLTEQGQPNSGTEYDNIAYHYVISGNGEISNTRDENVMGYHASNYEVNKKSIGICLTGNFDVECPSEAQYNSLAILVLKIKNNHSISEINGHNHYKPSKTCPGNNFDFNLLKKHMSKYYELMKLELQEAKKIGYEQIFDKFEGDEPLTEKDVKCLIEIANIRNFKK